MTKKKRYQYEKDKEDDDTFVSRSQKKRDSSLLQEIGEEIVTLPQPKLDKLPLSEDLKIAIAEYKRLSNKEAKRRQLQYIGRLMREAQELAYEQNTHKDHTSNIEKDTIESPPQIPDLVSAYLEMKKSW